jgi:hypothetical protein
MRRLLLLTIPLLALGCNAPDIKPVAGDVYVISSSASRYGTGKREDLIRQAEAYAESHGKVAVAVPQLGTLSGIDRGGVVEYRFRLLDKGGPVPQPAALPLRPEAAAAKVEKGVEVETAKAESKIAEQPAKEPNSAQPERKPDLYNELIKLDDLRKRGILTEEEFQAQKKKLLDGPQK